MKPIMTFPPARRSAAATASYPGPCRPTGPCLATAVPGPPLPPVPRYGQAALSDVLPSVLSALGVADGPAPLGLPTTSRAVVLLVDGLGERLLRGAAEHAPFLSALAGQVLTCGFPATTVTSLASLGTGLPPGAHGLTGLTSWVEEVGQAVAWLGWSPVGSSEDLRDRLVPEQVQPRPTAFERAADAGVAVTVAAPAQFAGSGLTRAVLRGGRWAGAVTPGDTVAQAVEGSRRGRRSLVYCYTPDLDLTGHVRGVDSEAWLSQLRLVDRFAEELATALPAGTTLLVTADHGMVDVADGDRVDADSTPELLDGVVALAGEPRARHVHVRPGAQDDVRAAWTRLLGDRMWVGSAEQALDAGLMGPTVTAEARRRVGDVVAIATGPVAVVRRTVEPVFARLLGQHGALTDDELLVPLLRAEA